MSIRLYYPNLFKTLNTKRSLSNHRSILSQKRLECNIKFIISYDFINVCDTTLFKNTFMFVTFHETLSPRFCFLNLSYKYTIIVLASDSLTERNFILYFIQLSNMQLIKDKMNTLVDLTSQAYKNPA